MNKLLTALFVFCIFLCFNQITVKATSISVNPERVVMQINDFGKIYEFTLKNNSNKVLLLTFQEGLVEVDSDGNATPLNKEVTKNFLEIRSEQMELAPGESNKLSVRSKIIANTTTEQFPALVITESGNDPLSTVPQAKTYIPFIAQNTQGELSLDTTLAINVESYSFEPQLQITGEVINDGDKFFTPMLSLKIFKDGKELLEQDLSSQVSGMLFPGEKKEFSFIWSNPDESLQAFGEYVIETHVENDLSEKNIGARVNYMYIPKQLIYISGGALGGIVLLTVILKLLGRRKAK